MREASNNFDLVRLIAATEVALYHSSYVLGVPLPPLAHDVVYGLPGVPIFFVVAGFLLTRSVARDADFLRYATNRFLRIYPGLWACFALTVVVVLASGVIDFAFLASDVGRGWMITQLAFGWGNPDPINLFGSGTPNPSLWTIAVELEFYVVLAVLLMVVAPRVSRRSFDVVLVGLAGASFALSVVRAETRLSSSATSFDVNLPPYLWVFLLGVLAARHWSSLSRFVVGHPILWLLENIVFYEWIFRWQTSPPALAALSLPRYVLLGGLALSVAYWRPHVADRLLRGRDLSYGIYLYHFVFVNCVVHWWPERTLGSSVVAMIAVLSATIAFAHLSWTFVESVALRRKVGPDQRRRSGIAALQPVPS